MNPRRDNEEDEKMAVRQFGRNIYFFSEVTAYSVCTTIQMIDKLEIESKTKPIVIIMNSPGGSCYDGWGLFDRMRTCRCPIITIGMGIVASMAFIIYLAGDKRIASQNCRFLNHQMSTEVKGRYTDIKIEQKEMQILEDMANKVVADRTGRDIKTVKKEVQVGDKYMGIEEAIMKGVVHDVIEYMEKK